MTLLGTLHAKINIFNEAERVKFDYVLYCNAPVINDLVSPNCFLQQNYALCARVRTRACVRVCVYACMHLYKYKPWYH